MEWIAMLIKSCHTLRFVTLILLMLSSDVTVASAADRLTIGVGVGTLGATLNVSQPVDSHTALRFTYGTYQFARNGQFDNVVIDVLTKLRLAENFRIQTAGFYVERTIRAPIRLTLGAVINQNRIAAVSVPADSSVVIDHYVYSAAQAGEVFTNVRWMPISPYFGFRFGSNVTARHRIAFVADVGAYYEGRAKVTFDANGAIKANQANFARYFSTLEGQLSRELSPVQVFPVLEVGMRLRI